MKDVQTQIHELSGRVEKLEQAAAKKKAEADYYKEQALFELRQAATMEAFGTYIENPGQTNERLVNVHFSDRKYRVEHFKNCAFHSMQKALKSEVM